jgi:hypothetical protein
LIFLSHYLSMIVSCSIVDARLGYSEIQVLRAVASTVPAGP